MLTLMSTLEVASENPPAFTTTRYEPGMRPSNRKSPLLPVVSVRSTEEPMP